MDRLLEAIYGNWLHEHETACDATFSALCAACGSTSGALDPSKLAECFSPSRHPRVLAGQRTRDQVRAEFLQSMECGPRGLVGLAEFKDFYRHLAFAQARNLADFEKCLRDPWVCGGERVGPPPESAPERAPEPPRETGGATSLRRASYEKVRPRA